MHQSTFTLNGKVWLEINGEKVIGPGRVELLERIHASGSIRQAALQMGMSYNQAWKLVRHINDHFEVPIVISTRGGKNGNNATVTKEGLLMAKQFHSLQEKFDKFMKTNINLIDAPKKPV
jgi:molybdate transport system regulatory protein